MTFVVFSWLFSLIVPLLLTALYFLWRANKIKRADLKRKYIKRIELWTQQSNLLCDYMKYGHPADDPEEISRWRQRLVSEGQGLLAASSRAPVAMNRKLLDALTRLEATSMGENDPLGVARLREACNSLSDCVMRARVISKELR